MRAISIGIPFIRRRSGVPIDAQAQAHFNRVIADGGVVPSGLSGVNAFFSAVKAIYGTSDINTAISAAYDPHYLGYKLGAGSGTTLGQAAQKLYSVKSTENLLLQSEDFGSANWTKLNSTITTNTTTAPNGTMTADSIVDNTTNAAHRVSQTDLSVTSGTTYTLSAYIRKGSVDYLNMAFGSSQFGSNGVFFDLTNFSVFSVSSGHSASITNEGSGWYRVTFTANCTSTGVSTIFINPTSSNVSASYIGNGSTNLIIWGAQVNTGSVALPYTQTTTTAQTLADVTQTTAASQPLLLAHTGENYWFGSGVTGNFVSTPNATANQITGDIDLGGYCNFLNSTGSDRAIIAKYNTQRAYALTINSLGVPVLYLNTATIVATASASVPFSTGWLRATRSASTGDVIFYHSSQAPTTSYQNIVWTKLGNTIPSTAVSIISSTNNVEVGSIFGGTAFNTSGIIHRAFICNSIGGNPVVDFNPSSYNPANSQTQWSSATGEVWTINTGTAATGYKGHLCTKTIIQGDGVDDRMSTSLPTYQYITRYASVLQYTMANGVRILAGTGAAHLLYNFVSPNVRAYNGLDLDFNNETVNRLQLFTANYNSLTSTGLLNNANTASGDTGTLTSVLLSILSNSTPAQFANASITTIIQANQVDNTAQNTAIYQYIRSINNNAF